MTWDIVSNIFLAAGGLGLFLYGMKMLSDGLENLAGDRLRSILERATSNRFLGVGVGIGVTCVVQSSTAATVMVVGFINAGLMTLVQSIGVIMGINIGTSITTQIISFKIDQISPLFIFAGALLYLVFKRRRLRNLGFVALGFGVLLLGFTVMGGPLKEFASRDAFRSMLTAFRNPVLALLAGIVFTAIIQSSTASIGIIIALYMGGMHIPLLTAAFLVLGCNIGTCFTALLAAIPASRDAKRAALVHLLYSVAGCLVFGPLIAFVPGILAWVQNLWPDGARQVAMFHTLFNTATLVLLLPFVRQLARLVQKIIPEREKENANIKRLLYCDSNALKTPETAVAQAHKEICRMGQVACDNLQLALKAFFTKDAELALEVLEHEKTINFLQREITYWLARIRSLELSAQVLEKTEVMLHIVASIERVGDYAENIAEYTQLEEKYGTVMSPQALEELTALSGAVREIIALALDIYKKYDAGRLPRVTSLKADVDALLGECSKNHMQRLKENVCDPRGGMVYTDLTIDLNHCSNHATYIAYSILAENAAEEEPAAAVGA
ncbi:MAG: Na/Pi cotransporter family protein [Firmicutes bacterium]|nr:Na/Pi cotransporter family protein [Bacillota bacterium]